MNLRECGRLIQRCADGGHLRLGEVLHGRLLTLHSTIPSNYLASKLISLYARTSRISHARKVFDQIPQPNLFAYNAMLIAYSLAPLPYEALRFFYSIPFPPDNFTLSSLLKSLASLPPSSLPPLPAHAVHCSAIRLLFHSDLFICNGLITLYAHTHTLLSARKLFDALSQRDVVSWNSIISGYAHQGYYEQCLQLFCEMKQGGDWKLRPNAVTILSALQACAHLQDLVTGIQVHRYAVDNGIQMDSALRNSIISLYAKCGSLEYARGVFEEMSDKDDVSYGAMITGYFSFGFVDNAMQLFRQMDNPAISTWNAAIAGLVQNNCYSSAIKLVFEMQASGVRPNSVTLSSILPAFSFFSNFLGGKQVHAYAIRNNHDHNIYVASALVDVYAKVGFLQGSRKVFEMTKVASVILWTAIISAYAAHGDANAALSLFYGMLRHGIKPDPVTFTAVLSACAHAGLVEKAHEIFNSMLPEYGISPAVEHYACMVGVFSRIGKLREAVAFIDKMSFEPNAKIWGALLSGAAVHGDTDVGVFAFERLFEIEPDNTGNYILMANLYWKSGKWEESDSVREKMKMTGYSKIPGCSWIETAAGLQVFVAQDVLNKQYAEAYQVLQELCILMRAEDSVDISEFNEEGDSYAQLAEVHL